MKPASIIKAELPAAFEQKLRQVLHSEVEFIELIAEDLLAAGGKRIRPQMALLVAELLVERADAGTDADALALAVCIELLHSASLLHDDLIDDADTRRGREAAYRRYGNVVSVMSGDFMLARLLMLLAELPRSAALTGAFGKTASIICEGEVLQFQVAAYGNYSKEQYFRIIYGKTAALLELAALAPALLYGADEAQQQALRVYGRELGMAFQIRDDLLDLFGTPEQIGKPIGSDLREGKATLPVLELLSTPARDEVEAILQRRAEGEDDSLRIRELCEQYGTRQQSEAELRRRLGLASESLEIFLQPSDATPKAAAVVAQLQDIARQLEPKERS